MPEVSAALPSCDAVQAYLNAFRGARAFHPHYTTPNGRIVEGNRIIGNNGDLLIRRATEMMMKKYAIESVPSAAQADLIILDGSGSMLDRYRTVPLALSTYAQSRKDKPLVMLPTSFVMAPGRIQALVGAGGAPMTLFCREQYSFDSLKSDDTIPDWCDIKIDHDMAFFLGQTDFVARLAGYAPEHVLFVERLDSEHAQRNFKRHWSVSLRSRIAKSIPRSIKPMVYPAVARLLGRRPSSFRATCENILSEKHSDALTYPIVSCDISLPNVSSFDDFCTTIAKSAVVFTTRLHVGILAAMLGRPVYLFEGAYHKIRGIYEHSLLDVDGVMLVSASSGARQ